MQHEFSQINLENVNVQNGIKVYKIRSTRQTCSAVNGIEQSTGSCYFYNILLTGVGAYFLKPICMVVAFLAWVFTNCFYGVSHLLGKWVICSDVLKVRNLIKEPCAVLFLSVHSCFLCVSFPSLISACFLVFRVCILELIAFFTLCSSKLFIEVITEPDFHSVESHH